jgi:MFS family permease
MFEFYRSMTPEKRRTFWACYGGFGLDGFDVMMFSFVIPTLTTLWSMSKGEAGSIATVTLIASAFGGWIAGILSDRFGRVRVLQITILWYAFFTFLCGFTNSPQQLMITRGLQGFGFGGEWAAGSVLMGEVIATRYRGRAVGFVQSSWAIGWAIAAIVATLALQFLPDAIGWRVLFFTGLAPAGLVFFIRRLVPESPVYQAAESRERKIWTLPLAMFSRKVVLSTLLGSLLSVGAQGGYYAITTWIPTFLRDERHLTVLGSGPYLAMIITGSLVGYIASAILTDVIGRRANFLLFAIGSATIVILYTHVPISDQVMLFLGFPLGFFASGIFSGMGPLYSELFPTEFRATAQGFCYNFGRGIAAFFPAWIGIAAAAMALGDAVALFAAGSYALLAIAALLLPETRDRKLDDIPLDTSAAKEGAG